MTIDYLRLTKIKEPRSSQIFGTTLHLYEELTDHRSEELRASMARSTNVETNPAGIKSGYRKFNL
jgi:hypothetical protein